MHHLEQQHPDEATSSSPNTTADESIEEQLEEKSRLFRPAAGSCSSTSGGRAFWTSNRWPNKTTGVGTNKDSTAMLQTTERPLLTDFPSPGVLSPMGGRGPTLTPQLESQQQHIYMEIPPPWNNQAEGGYENAHTLGGGVSGSGNSRGLVSSVQPIHLPLLGPMDHHGRATLGPPLDHSAGSTSSQSSGYGSSNTATTSHPYNKHHHHHQLMPQQLPQQHHDSFQSRTRPQTLFRLRPAAESSSSSSSTVGFRQQRNQGRNNDNNGHQPDIVTLEDLSLIHI